MDGSKCISQAHRVLSKQSNKIGTQCEVQGYFQRSPFLFLPKTTGTSFHGIRTLVLLRRVGSGKRFSFPSSTDSSSSGIILRSRSRCSSSHGGLPAACQNLERWPWSKEPCGRGDGGPVVGWLFEARREESSGKFLGCCGCGKEALLSRNQRSNSRSSQRRKNHHDGSQGLM